MLATAGCSVTYRGRRGIRPPATGNLVAAARTGSSSVPPAAPGTIEPAFRARANAACAPYNSYNDSHPFPYPHFNPLEPDSALLPKIGRFLAQSPVNTTFLSTMRKLGSPTRGSAEWAVILADVAKYQNLVTEQIKAAKAGNSRAFVATLKPLTDAEPDILTAWIVPGFKADDLCTSLFES